MLRYFSFLFVILSVACTQENVKQLQAWEMDYPKDNLADAEKAKMGKALFFDMRLSSDNSISCASCHNPNLAFADTVAKSSGVNGKHAGRNSPSIINAGFAPHFMGEGQVPSLEMQVLLPLLDENEMGAEINAVIKELKPFYNETSLEVFGKSFDAYVLTRALATYERTLVAYSSPFDLYIQGIDTSAINDAAKKGWELFNEKMNCVACHPYPKFTSYALKNNAIKEKYFDPGRYKVTGRFKDKGKFKVPSLRNVALTHPYMHDGSYKTLHEVINNYSAGGKNHPNKDSLIKAYHLEESDKLNLIAFLESLTDTIIHIP